MKFALILCLAFCLGRGVYLRWLVARYQLVQVERRGLLSWELWRRASLVAHSDGMGGHTFPRPRECRILLLRVAGVPAWRESQSLALPRHAEDSIQTVQADEFDAAFAPRFRIVTGNARSDSSNELGSLQA